MNKFFNNVKSIEELKAEYKKLARKNHPDMGGSVEVMQEINNEYDRLFKKYENIHTDANGNTYTKESETKEAPEQFRNIINELIRFDIEINVVGSWLWITGNTYSCKDVLKSLGFKWASKKKAWYWHSEEETTGRRSRMSLEQIKDKYGCETFKGKEVKKLTA